MIRAAFSAAKAAVTAGPKPIAARKIPAPAMMLRCFNSTKGLGPPALATKQLPLGPLARLARRRFSSMIFLGIFSDSHRGNEVNNELGTQAITKGILATDETRNEHGMGRGQDGARREPRPTGRARFPPSRDSSCLIRVPSVAPASAGWAMVAAGYCDQAALAVYESFLDADAIEHRAD